MENKLEIGRTYRFNVDVWDLLFKVIAVSDEREVITCELVAYLNKEGAKLRGGTLDVGEIFTITRKSLMGQQSKPTGPLAEVLYGE